MSEMVTLQQLKDVQKWASLTLVLAYMSVAPSEDDMMLIERIASQLSEIGCRIVGNRNDKGQLTTGDVRLFIAATLRKALEIMGEP